MPEQKEVDDEVESIIARFNLKPHPEGGFYTETYRSQENFVVSNKNRSASTAIYFLLTSDSFSEMHRLCHDEIFHFYCGDQVEMLQLYPDGSSAVVYLGNQLLKGDSPQCIVPGNVWQGSRVAGGGRFALIGTTVSPGFDFADFERGDRQVLSNRYPQCFQMIESLTRGQAT